MAGQRTFRDLFVRELALFAVLFLVGLILLPLTIYLVGQFVFGEYGGGGFGGFHGAMRAELAAGNAAAWFLVLSPYAVWQLLRLTVLGFRYAGSANPGGRPAGDL